MRLEAVVFMYSILQSLVSVQCTYVLGERIMYGPGKDRFLPSKVGVLKLYITTKQTKRLRTDSSGNRNRFILYRLYVY